MWSGNAKSHFARADHPGLCCRNSGQKGPTIRKKYGLRPLPFWDFAGTKKMHNYYISFFSIVSILIMITKKALEKNGY